MNEISYSKLNFKNPAAVRRAAEIHESAPANWVPGFVPKKEAIDFMTELFLKASEDSQKLFLVALDGQDEIVGFHWVEITEKHRKPAAHICSLWTDERIRGQGVGRELKKRGEEWAREKNAELIFTEVFFNNKKMFDYNLKLGFAAQQVEMIKPLTERSILPDRGTQDFNNQ